MTHSRNRTPITGNTNAESEKEDKSLANRRLRRKVKVQLRHEDSETVPIVAQKEVGNPWNWAKDGKHFLSPESRKKYCRK